MGTIVPVSSGDFKEFQKHTQFTPDELTALFRRYRFFDKDGNGVLSVDEFTRFPELNSNPLLLRLLAVLDTNGDCSIDFREFVTALYVLSHPEMQEEKLQFIFRVYDVDNDGFIGNGELFQVLKLMTVDNLTDEQLQQVVDKTIAEGDRDGDGMLSFVEFKSLLVGGASGISEKLLIPLNLIQASDSGAEPPIDPLLESPRSAQSDE